MKVLTMLLIGVLLISYSACVLSKKTDGKKPLQTVSHVDLNRYLGK